MIAMCGLQLKYGIIAKDMMLILGLYETIDQLPMTNNLHCYVIMNAL